MHADHITGTGQLKKLSGCKSIISRASGAAADILVDEKDTIALGNHKVRILSTPGHTNGCVTYYIPEQVRSLVVILKNILGRYSERLLIFKHIVRSEINSLKCSDAFY